MEDKDKTNVANGHLDPGPTESQSELPSGSAASKVVQQIRGGRAEERKVSGSGTHSREAGSELLTRIRKMGTARAGEITEALLGEGAAYVATLLQSPVALRKAVETAEAILSPKPGGAGDAGFTTVQHRRRKLRKQTDSAKGSRGSRGRGRGRGSRGSSRGGSSAQAKAISMAKPAERKQTPGPQPAPAPAQDPKARQPKSGLPRENAWNKKLQVSEWGLMAEEEEPPQSEAGEGNCTQPFMSEDNDDDVYPVDPALESAMDCPIRRQGGSVWGIVVRIRSRMATVVWGENSALKIRLPTRGANSKLKVGDTVAIVTRKSQHPDGQITLSHVFANLQPDEAPRPTRAELPRVKAVVTSFESFVDDSGKAMVEEEGGIGEAVVPLTGFTGHFRAPHHQKIVAGSSFWFTPAFEGTAMVIDDLQEGCAITPPRPGKPGEQPVYVPPATRADLVEGFRCPERQLQAVLKEKFRVDVMPFVGSTKTVFEYSMGADLVRAFDRKGKAKGKQAMSLMDLEEVLVKAVHYRKLGLDSKAAADDNSARQDLLSKQVQLKTLTTDARARILWAEHRKSTLETRRERVTTLEEKLHKRAALMGTGPPVDDSDGEAEESVVERSSEETKPRKPTPDTWHEAAAELEEELNTATSGTNNVQMRLKRLKAEFLDFEKDSAEGLRLAGADQEAIQKLKDAISALEARRTDLSEESKRKLLERIRTQHKHFYVPTAQNAAAFAKWIKRDLGRAARNGERLQAVVGVFVDENCTIGSLYNTEDVPYANMKQCPWTRSFTLLRSPVICYTLDKHGGFVPSESSRQGKRLLLVELDSQFQSSGALPKPSELELHQPGLSSGSIVQPTDLLSREFVLVSLAEDDPRFRMLVLQGGASVYKRKGNLVVLACPFSSLADAEKFVLGLAANPRGVFGMLKRDLYAPDTLTLTCSGEKPVKAEELFFLVNAMGVLPIGGNRYRITTNMTLLEAAQVFHFQNEYVQGDNKKFISLRDDKNQYTMLDTKKPPKNLKSYYRREPVQDIVPQPQSTVWYQVTNLPNGISANVLLRAFQQTSWWPSEAKEILLDERPFHPEAWFSVSDAKTSVVPVTAVVANRPVAIVESAAPYSLLQRPSLAPETKDPMAILNFGERELDWRPGGKTKALVSKKASGKQRAIKRKEPPKPGPAGKKVQQGLSGPPAPKIRAARFQNPERLDGSGKEGKGQQSEPHGKEAITEREPRRAGQVADQEPNQQSDREPDPKLDQKLDHKLDQEPGVQPNSSQGGSTSEQEGTMETSDDVSDKEPVLGEQSQTAGDGAVSGNSKAGTGRKRDRPSQSSDEDTPRSASVSRGHFPQQATPKKTKAVGGETGTLDRFLYRFTSRTQSTQASQSSKSS